MKVLFDNVDFRSPTGPNQFTYKLARQLQKMGVEVYPPGHPVVPDVHFATISTRQKRAPLLQRLDNIYFYQEEDWIALNRPIFETYCLADAVVFQGNFSKSTVERFFGPHPNAHVIHNGTSLEDIAAIAPYSHPNLDAFDGLWMCAAQWRPSKRLSENVRYFLEFGSEKDGLLIAGEGVDYNIKHPRVVYLGQVLWEEMIALMKRCRFFLHLGYIDCCPNVVVDARACGCHIICASSGGTEEIAGRNSTIVDDYPWEGEEIKLFASRPLNFSTRRPGRFDICIDMKHTALQYYQAMLQIKK